MKAPSHLLLPVVAASFVASIVAACGGARSTGSSTPAPKSVVAPAGVTLVAACTPTGAELCFNAVDDNCNGVFEEGCGLRTGPLQFMIAWSGSDANVDLAVTAPNGERTSKENRSPSSGLRFEKDCPVETCHGQDYENVYLEEASILRGHYEVEIRLREAGASSGPVTVRFGARVGAGTYGADVVLTRSDDKKSFGFDL
ncbi:MAG: hypothetical protein U0169_02370 [Polyangiaceae bacterium]